MKNIRNSKAATLGLERVIKQQNETMQQLTAGLQDALYSIAESLDNLIESIDCAGANNIDNIDFWLKSDIAAIDKANELSISILPEYSMADLRYKIYCAIN